MANRTMGTSWKTSLAVDTQVRVVHELGLGALALGIVAPRTGE